MQPQTPLPTWFRLVLILTLGIPLALACVLTLTQQPPATWVIDTITDDTGHFSLRLAIVLTFILFLLPILAALGIAVLVKGVWQRMSLSEKLPK
ncbi:MAG: hypothetical protein SF053_10745 [Bacteroidia bacterium]|nr:hypothetical protein [Bacteroidia bacterium]